MKRYDSRLHFQIKAYAEARGWTEVTWINGYSIGLPPPCKWNPNPFNRVVIHIPEGQLELAFPLSILYAALT